MEFNKIIKLMLVFALVVIIALNLGIRTVPESGEIMETATDDLSAIFASFLLAFEILAILLTAAMVGAIVIAKKDKKTNLKGGDMQ